METIKKLSLFWDVESVDPQKNKQFIIERILNFGDEKDFRWAVGVYGEKDLKEAIMRNQTIAKKSLSFWCQIFNINKEKCLTKQSMRRQSAFWKK